MNHLLFNRPVEVQKHITFSAVTSALSKIIIDDSQSRKSSKSTAGKIPLTIYLPDCSEMEIYVVPSWKMGKLIELILREHEEQDLEPALDYNIPTKYELRMHEGDGEPDRDFPAFDREKSIEHFNFDEYCLCEIEEDNDNAYRTFSVNDSIFSPGYMGSASGKSFENSFHKSSDKTKELKGGNPSNSSNHPHRDQGSRYHTDDDSDDDDDDEDDDNDEEEGGKGEKAVKNFESASYLSHQALPMIDNFVTIRFPAGHQISLPHDQETTLRQLLPLLAESQKIKLHTDEFEFVISNQDQRALFVSHFIPY